MKIAMLAIDVLACAHKPTPNKSKPMISSRALLLPLFIALSMSVSCVTAKNAPKKTAKLVEPACVAPPIPQCELDTEGSDEPLDPDTCRVQQVGEFRVGWLKQGMPLSEVKARLGEPSEVSEPEEEGASGDIYRNYEWPSAGVSIDGRDYSRGDNPVIHSVTVTPPFMGMTERCIGLGSTLAQVQAAYPGMRDPNTQEPDPRGSFVAGSIYGGIFFLLDERGEVVQIFIGAGAE